MTAPRVDFEKLAAIVNDPEKVKLLPLTLVAKIHQDLARKDATSVTTPEGSMAATGTTPSQKEGLGILSNALQKFVTPFDYDSGRGQIEDHKFDILKTILGISVAPKKTDPSNEPYWTGYRSKMSPWQEDSWSLYLGKPQTAKTFDLSPFKPTAGSKDTEYFSIHDFLPRFITSAAVARELPLHGFDMLDKSTAVHGRSPVQILKGLVDRVKSAPNGRLALNDDTQFNMTEHDRAPQAIMRNFQLSHGHDEVGPYLAYYDKWDLDTPGASAIGKPYEIYGRMYYDPKTYVPIPESEVLAKKAKLDLSAPENKAAIQKWLSEISNAPQ